MGAGFVLAVSARWPGPEAAFRTWHAERATSGFGLGAVQFVPVGPEPWVANLIGQRGIKRGAGGPPVRYEAIDAGLAAVGNEALELGASVHMPRIACGLAGGSWDRVEPLVVKHLSARGVAVTVYDLGT